MNWTLLPKITNANCVVSMKKGTPIFQNVSKFLKICNFKTNKIMNRDKQLPR